MKVPSRVFEVFAQLAGEKGTNLHEFTAEEMVAALCHLVNFLRHLGKLIVLEGLEVLEVNTMSPQTTGALFELSIRVGELGAYGGVAYRNQMIDQIFLRGRGFFYNGHDGQRNLSDEEAARRCVRGLHLPIQEEEVKGRDDFDYDMLTALFHRSE